MTSLVDRATLLLFILLLKLLRSLPLKVSRAVVRTVLRLFFSLLPSLNRNSLKNLGVVYPEKSDEEKLKILNGSYAQLARTIVDFARLPLINSAWVNEHIVFPQRERLEELYKSEEGVLCVTGHLGSFDLILQVVCMLGFDGSIVVRDLKLPKLNSWINEYRGMNGAGSFSRGGAIKKIISFLKSGKDIGILFDQNVTRNHAVFVPWFGKIAATTIAPAFAALQTNCHVVVISLQSLQDDKYKFLFSEVDLGDLRQDQSLTRELAIQKITERIVAEYEKMILAYPEGWFWMHRRWKTAPEGTSEDFYD